MLAMGSTDQTVAAAELQTPGRILATSTARNLVAEVTRDTVERWGAKNNTLGDSALLYQLGYHVATIRIQAGRTQMDILGALVDAVGDSRATGTAGPLALLAGVVEALVWESAAVTPVGTRACVILARLAHAAPVAELVEGPVVAMAQTGLMHHVVRIAQDGSVLRSVAVDKHPELVAALVGAGTLQDARWAADQIQCTAVAVLVAQEQSGNDAVGQQQMQQAAAVVRVAEAIGQRCFVDEVRVPAQALVPLWCTVVDAMAMVEFATLQHGRAGPEEFRRAITVLVQFMTSHTDLADTAVRRVFDTQPCLRFLAHQPAGSVARARSCVVLFYLDLLEHIVGGGVSAATLQQLVLPLAAKYAVVVPASDMFDWFESAHALILACLETGSAREIVPWYTQLLLCQYPDSGITATLLRIAYTAAVRSISARDTPGSAVLARECVVGLLSKIDDYAPTIAAAAAEGMVAATVRTVHRRELLGVLVAQLAVVPLQMLPQLMAEVKSRIESEPDWATRKATMDDLQLVVLGQADLPRKPALSTWVWQLLKDTNEKV